MKTETAYEVILSVLEKSTPVIRRENEKMEWDVVEARVLETSSPGKANLTWPRMPCTKPSNSRASGLSTKPTRESRRWRDGTPTTLEP